MSGQPVNIEIPADDTTRAREFWGSLFGWKFEASRGLFEYDVARISEHSAASITDMEPGKRGIRIYFDVDDINASIARVQPASRVPCRIRAGPRSALTSRGTDLPSGRTTLPPLARPTDAARRRPGSRMTFR